MTQPDTTDELPVVPFQAKTNAEPKTGWVEIPGVTANSTDEMLGIVVDTPQKFEVVAISIDHTASEATGV